MGFLGIGGSTTGAVVSGVTSFASDYYENRDIPVSPGELDFVLLTHAHMDPSEEFQI